MAGAATTPGSALTHVYGEKLRKVGEDCRRKGIICLPIAANSLGGWHPVAVEQMQKLGSAIARQTGQEESEVMRQLFQHLSLYLMKGNAAILTNRIPDH